MVRGYMERMVFAVGIGREFDGDEASKGAGVDVVVKKKCSDVFGMSKGLSCHWQNTP